MFFVEFCFFCVIHGDFHVRKSLFKNDCPSLSGAEHLTHITHLSAILPPGRCSSRGKKHETDARRTNQDPSQIYRKKVNSYKLRVFFPQHPSQKLPAVNPRQLISSENFTRHLIPCQMLTGKSNKRISRPLTEPLLPHNRSNR